MSTDAQLEDTGRDPRIDPQNGDILYRSDIADPLSVRVCHGSNEVGVGDRQIVWVRFELPRKNGKLKTIRLDTWRTWCTEATVLSEDDLEKLLSTDSVAAAGSADAS